MLPAFAFSLQQSVGILKNLDPDEWHVVVVAPENYFLFHPLLRTFLTPISELSTLLRPNFINFLGG